MGRKRHWSGCDYEQRDEMKQRQMEADDQESFASSELLDHALLSQKQGREPYCLERVNGLGKSEANLP